MITLTDRIELRARALQLVEAGELGGPEACELLAVRPRTLRWLRQQYRQEGVRGLVHGNTGKRPANALPVAIHEEIVTFAKQERCSEMNHVYLGEMLAQEKKIFVSRSTVRRDVVGAGMDSPRPKKRRKLYRRRAPRPRTGMLLQMDASPHVWVGGLPEFSLHTAVDDADRDLEAVHRPHEDIWGYFEVFRRVAIRRGLPEAIYVDRHSIFGGSTPTHKKLQTEFSQFERAMHELGVRVIKAKSAQAKGRVEKYNDTLQDRLVAWFKYEGISTMAEVGPSLNKYLRQHQRRFTIAPKDPVPAWRPIPDHLCLDDVLCLKYSRVVRLDNTITFRGKLYDLPAGPRGSSRAKHVVHVLQYFDGTLRAASQGEVIAQLSPPPGPHLPAEMIITAHQTLLSRKPQPASVR